MASGPSPLQPRMIALAFSKCFLASRNSDASLIQPLVLAFTKK